MRLEGIHHVTAVTGDVRRNVDFHTRVLGLRLVAKSVNQDDPLVYHVFYSDEVGNPGADLTFFEYRGAVRGRAGAGMVHRVIWRVASREALDFWEQRLNREGIARLRDGDTLHFADPEGLAHELVLDSSTDAPRIADHPQIPHEMALRGFDGVRAYVSDPAASGEFVERVMDATRREGDTWELRGDSRGGTITYDAAPAEPGRPGAGTVHHVAWGAPMAQHATWVDTLRGHRVGSTDVVDRHYFQSIYFREPGHVLFEIASDGPGFARDGTLEDLGRTLILPPWYEQDRARIEAALTPIPDPRADWGAGAGR